MQTNFSMTRYHNGQKHSPINIIRNIHTALDNVSKGHKKTLLSGKKRFTDIFYLIDN